MSQNFMQLNSFSKAVGILTVVIVLTFILLPFSGCDSTQVAEEQPHSIPSDIKAEFQEALKSIKSTPLGPNNWRIDTIKQSEEYKTFEERLRLESKSIDWSSAVLSNFSRDFSVQAVMALIRPSVDTDLDNTSPKAVLQWFFTIFKQE